MSKKIFIAFSLVGILATKITAADGMPDTCGYHPISGEYQIEAETYLFASWEHARECAAKGLLPEVVANRLGKWGDEPTKREAEEILKLNMGASYHRSQDFKSSSYWGEKTKIYLDKYADKSPTNKIESEKDTDWMK
jgi:hypothetical protein